MKIIRCSNKKLMKSFTVFSLAIIIAFGSSGCNKLPLTRTNPPHYEEGSENVEKRTYIDSVGRKSEITEINRVVPSGRVAQLMISMVAPKKLVSVSEIKKMYQDGIPDDLPITGQLYGGRGSVNYETMVKMKPDVILDMGEVKNTIKEDMDDLSSVTNVPTIFLQADLEHTPEAFRALGELLGEPERGEKLAKFTEDALKFAEEGRSKIKEKNQFIKHLQMMD